MSGQTEESVPARMQPIFESITSLTDAFCQEHLTEEYAALARKMAAALARKRPSPLERGAVEVWACGILYALGQINFLFDKSQTPYMRADELCQRFGVGKSTGGAKAKAITTALKMTLYDFHWSLPSRLANHPTAWWIQVNGFMVDARHMPREIQEEAFRRGLIPYVPGQE